MSSLPDPVLFSANDGEPALRWGVVGPGWIAGAFIEAVHAHTPQRVVAVASRSHERAMEFASQFDIDAAYGTLEGLLADTRVDVVYVATPATDHARVALGAIAAGKHVLIEKPLSTSVEDAERILDAGRRAGVLVMEAMWTRYLPQTSVLRQLLADGAIGDPRAVLADNGQAIPFSAEHRLYRPELGGGALFDIGVYAFQLASMVFGAPDRIHAFGTMTATGVDGASTSILEYRSGAQSTIFSSILSRTPAGATITGTEGLIRFPRHFANPGTFTLETSDPFEDPERWTDRTGLEWFDGLSWQVNAFAKYVGDGRVESPLHTHAETVAIIHAIATAHDLVKAGA